MSITGTRAGLPFSLTTQRRRSVRFRHVFYMQGKKLEKNEARMIQKMLADGKGYQFIADTVGCSVPTVSVYANQFGLRRRSGHGRLSSEQRVECVSLYKGGMTLVEIAEMFGVHYTTVIKYIHEAGVRTCRQHKEHRWRRDRNDLTFPKGRVHLYTEEMFQRAMSYADEIGKAGAVYKANYKRLIFHRAEEVKDSLGSEIFAKLKEWAGVKR